MEFDPAAYIYGSTNVTSALIIVIPGMLSPLIMAWLIDRQQRRIKVEDYRRQDEVAVKAAAAAKLLIENTKAANSKLDVIHTLVNSNMTAEMQANLDSKREVLAQLLEIKELKKAAGLAFSVEATEVIGAARGKITELEAALADRLKQSKEIEKIQNEKMIADMKKEANGQSSK